MCLGVSGWGGGGGMGGGGKNEIKHTNRDEAGGRNKTDKYTIKPDQR